MSISRHSLWPVIALLILAVTIAGRADERSAKESQLREVLQQIEQLKQAIEVKENSKSEYIQQLKSVETQIGSINRKIRRIRQQIDAGKTRLSALRETRRQHQRQLSTETEYLAEQVYAAFTMGRQERVKMLFSQRDPERLQRNLVYYQYFSNARVALIDDVQENIERLIETEARIEEARRQLEADRADLDAQKQRLAADRDQRESIIASLDRQLAQQGGSLSRLEQEARQLQQLIDSIQQLLDEAPEGEISRARFAELKGRLAWPVEGKVRRLFNRKKPYSDLRWQGVVIEAPGGREVRAVSHGRVAFADWLRGLGNLIIIDHGNSYLSLYGHNESLYKSAGEWVDAGNVIASIGSSGGQQEAGLYFEIRKNGKPQNPTRWCKSGNGFSPG
ncbi:MAG TPA: peptidoglycan DD-metalloendopeptidase family protein [Gammaproteobacteria bacterium]|jgi:septal ring factor EnvC (AmiA/AmiB activator)